MLNKFKQDFANKFLSVSIDFGANTGFGSGHNSNLLRAESDFFLVSNVDLEFNFDSLTVLVNSAKSADLKVAAWECRQKPYEHPKHYDPVTGEVLWCSSACVLFRTSAIREIGGYDPRFFMYGEDVELSYRMRDNGYLLHYVPKSVVWHYSYEEVCQVKPLQFLGSTVANVLIRCRFGRWHEVLLGFFMYLGLFFVPRQFPNQRYKLFQGFFKIIRLAPHFLMTRHQSDEKFPFRFWDYEMTREGAFYEYQNNMINNAPLVTVIVRTMPRRTGKLREALASVAAQTYENIELVVVEDGGNSAQAAIEKYRSIGIFSKIVYLPQEKVGRCVAGNLALAAASGDLVCFLDDDDLFYADHIEVLTSEWMKNPELGAVYGLAFQVKTEIESHEPWVYRDLEHSVVYRQSFSRVLIWHHNYLPIQTVLFRRDLYLDYGGFDEDLDNLEDWNLWVRYSLHHDFLMVSKVTSLYRVPSVSTQAFERQKVLDDYYEKAQDKHSRLRVSLSPTEVLKMTEELSRELYVAVVPVHPLRKLALRIPGLRRIYHPLRRVYHLFRKARNRAGG